MSGAFEGSFGGDGARLRDHDRMECGVCWWIYEPAVGDDVWQIGPQTPFSALPEHWRCPHCDARQDQFMVLHDAFNPAPADHLLEARDKSRATPQALAADRQRLRDGVLAAYESSADAMGKLPVYNKALCCALVGPRRFAGGWVGVAVTPWCMNLFVAGDESDARREGMQRELAFPSGSYRFTVAHLKGLSPLEVCSLFSPMDEFTDQAGAEAVATEALRALLLAEPTEKPGGAARSLSRRELLRPSPVMRSG